MERGWRTNLASVNVVFGKTLLGGIALGADIATAQLLKRHLVGIDISAVDADVSGKLLLAVCELAPKPSWRWLLVQFLDIDWALTPDLRHKAGEWAQERWFLGSTGTVVVVCSRKTVYVSDRNSWC